METHTLGETDYLFIGTGKGLVIRDADNNRIYKFDNPEVDLSFSVYPNPFLINNDWVYHGEGHVKFRYENPNNNIIIE